MKTVFITSLIIVVVLVTKQCLAGFRVNSEFFDDFIDEFDGNLRYSPCNGLLKPTVTLKKLDATPNKFFIPQNISMSIFFDVESDLEAPLKVKIKISKNLGYVGYVTLPCIANYGSCSFDRICTILDNYPKDSFAYAITCPRWLRESGVKCQCPFEKGSYGIANVRVPLESSIVPKWIAVGDYKVALIIEDKTRTTGCFQFQFRLS